MNTADKTIINIIAKSSEAFLLLVSSLIMVRYFTKDEYGLFLQVMLVVNTVVMLGILGMPQSIYYFFPKAISKWHFVVHNLLLIVFIGCVAAVGTYIIVPVLSNWFNNPGLADLSIYPTLMVFFRIPITTREPILISSGYIITTSILMTVANLITYGSIIAATVISVAMPHLLAIMTASFAIETVVYFSCILFLFRKQHSVIRSDQEDKKLHDDVSFIKQIKYALPISISSYLTVVGRQVDQYFISTFFNPRSLAVYSRGAIRLPVLSSIQYTVNEVLMPKYLKAYQEGDTQKFLQYYHLGAEKVAKINFPTFAFLFAAAPQLITFFYTKNYLEAVPVFRVYLLLLIIGVTVFGIVPRIAGKTKSLLYSTIIALVVNIALSVFFIKLIGPVGAALATVLATSLSFLYLAIVSCKIININISKMLPWFFLVKLMFLSLIASLPIYMLNFFVSPEGFAVGGGLFVQSLLYTYLYIFFLVRGNLLYSEDYETLGKWLRCDAKKILHILALKR